MKMKKKILSAAVMAALGAGSAQATMRTDDGQGGLLLFPYYTVQGNNETLVTITNVTDKGRAVKVRFREAFNSREVLAFNLYLAPFDVWVGKVQKSPDGGAQLYTPDNSCNTLDTNPKNMLNYDYSGSRSDGGPEGPARQREGYISVIEMGEIDSQATVSLGGHEVKVWDRNNDGIIDIVHKNGVPNYCQGIDRNFSDIWKEVGINSGLKMPGDGLMGSLAIINVQSGSEVSVRSTGIKKVWPAPVHNLPGSILPDLRLVRTISLLIFPDDGGSGDGDWFTWSARQFGIPDGVDGLSAALLASTVINEYTVNPATEAETAWVVTFPTKNHYVDPEFATDINIAAYDGADDGWHVDGSGNPKPYPPFTTIFDGKACEPVSFKMSDRDGKQVLVRSSGVSQRQPDAEGVSLCYGANVIQFGSTSNVFDAKNTVTRVSDDALAGPSGWASLGLSGNGHEMVYNGKKIFEGLPVIGFKATVIGNSNVGIGASYAVANSHAYKRAKHNKP